jgi:short-subunit dehydrogenase
MYALTGHTRGIGQSLFERLSPDVIGFSKSTGYDITRREDRDRILNESDHCDVFINNATDGFGQTELLMELFLRWKDRDKKIINVGSRIAEIVLPEKRIHLLQYSAYKKSLKAIIPELQGYKCRVEYKWFGYVGTEDILKKYPHFTEKDYITLEQACDIILN